MNVSLEGECEWEREKEGQSERKREATASIDLAHFESSHYKRKRRSGHSDYKDGADKDKGYAIIGPRKIGSVNFEGLSGRGRFVS